MKLSKRLSILAVLTYSVISLVVSSIIYVLFCQWLEGNECNNLKNKTFIAAIYYLEKDEQSVSEHENIQKELQKLISRSNISVVDDRNQVTYGEMQLNEYLSADFLDKVRAQQERFFTTDAYFYHSIYYEDNQGDFVVVTRESKDNYNQQTDVLFYILLLAFFVGIIAIFLIARVFGRMAYAPLVNIVDQIKNRNQQNFSQPIELERTYSEIEDLVKTYNRFIDQIAKTFSVQKNFTDYVSHELRTPLAALLGTLEVTNQKNRSEEEYKSVLIKLQQYTQDLEETLDKMMLLSGVKTNFEFKQIRIDEIIWNSVENAILYHNAHIDVDIQVSNSNLFLMQGNDKLLEMAFNNLLENAIKYSHNKPIKIVLSEEDNHLSIAIIDQGIGILESDRHQILQNFYRGANAKEFNGKGIGLSMASTIFNLHQIDLNLLSPDIGTVVFLRLNQF
ncbi:sensor histidine kinase [Sphingobacterium hungaricum]|uniref:histidine kinase n=1 Tax=Sphingobacterium hungaricum TaxID=2082723 RepID=A0A928UWC4_9SPHI|nr:HAMP domain-containing sensor histidine kinase [Sphingobacterium hungaricum]MBE8712314.1 histidine kinase [Sphingobacterium hungaricum]